jgi:hypothetical protein
VDDQANDSWKEAAIELVGDFVLPVISDLEERLLMAKMRLAEELANLRRVEQRVKEATDTVRQVTKKLADARSPLALR